MVPHALCSLRRRAPNHALHRVRCAPCVMLRHCSPLPVQPRAATVVLPASCCAATLPSLCNSALPGARCLHAPRSVEEVMGARALAATWSGDDSVPHVNSVCL
jgi:hypothetical protein